MSKIVKLAVFVVVAGAVAFFAARWLVERVSPMPGNLGVADGRLAPCPDSPNCVSTRATDEQHGIAPLSYTGETAVAQAAVLAIIEARPEMTLIRNEPGYIHAEARSALWRFIDDVEFQFDEEAGLIHFRSASRLGYSDAGVNRSRMEEIRLALES